MVVYQTSHTYPCERISNTVLDCNEGDDLPAVSINDHSMCHTIHNQLILILVYVQRMSKIISCVGVWIELLHIIHLPCFVLVWSHFLHQLSHSLLSYLNTFTCQQARHGFPTVDRSSLGYDEDWEWYIYLHEWHFALTYLLNGVWNICIYLIQSTRSVNVCLTAESF